MYNKITNKTFFLIIIMLELLSACKSNSNTYFSAKPEASPQTTVLPTSVGSATPNIPSDTNSTNAPAVTPSVNANVKTTAHPTVSPKTAELVLSASQLDSIYNDAYNAFHSGKYSLAVNLCDKVLKVDPNHYKALNIKGIALSFQDKFEEGMKNIDASLSIKPDYGYGRFNKALAYEYDEQVDNALIWYDKALEIENYIWSHYGKASCFGRIGDAPNAAKNLKIAISMDSSVIELAKKEKDFNKVRNSKEFKEIIK